MWPNSYEAALIEWNELRQRCQTLPLEECLHTVNDWWAKCPLVNHYLHPADIVDWPKPWDLLADNIFCDIAKCLGIVYTLLLIDHQDVFAVEIIQTHNYYVVSVNNERFILNDQPGSIESDINELGLVHRFDSDVLRQKVQ